MVMKCQRCQREITEEQSFVYQDKVYCEDCLMDIGLSTGECDPWATYVDTRTRDRLGLHGAEGLSETERKVYELIKSRGKATREEVTAELGLSAADLKLQLIPLLHADLVKEHGEGGQIYLFPIG